MDSETVMTLNKTLIVVLLAVALSALSYWKGCADGRRATHAPTARADTVRITIPPVHDTIGVQRWRVLWTGRDTVWADRVLREIDTALVRDSVRELVACADTIARFDTIAVCYSYRRRAFDFRIGFAPRVVAVPTAAPPWLASHYVAGAEVDLDRAVFVYAGMEATLWQSIRGSAHVGIRGSNGLAANARVGLSIGF